MPMKTSTVIVVGLVLATATLAGCDRPTDQRNASKPPPVAPAPATRPSNPTAVQGIDDAGITAKVKAALLAEKDVNGTDINVDTTKGIVTLTGRVPDPSQIERAAQIARTVEGVTTVQNKLTAGAG
jgi:hyperosmotically inducible protein